MKIQITLSEEQEKQWASLEGKTNAEKLASLFSSFNASLIEPTKKPQIELSNLAMFLLLSETEQGNDPSQSIADWHKQAVHAEQYKAELEQCKAELKEAQASKIPDIERILLALPAQQTRINSAEARSAEAKPMKPTAKSFADWAMKQSIAIPEQSNVSFERIFAYFMLGYKHWFSKVGIAKNTNKLADYECFAVFEQFEVENAANAFAEYMELCQQQLPSSFEAKKQAWLGNAECAELIASAPAKLKALLVHRSNNGADASKLRAEIEKAEQAQQAKQAEPKFELSDAHKAVQYGADLNKEELEARAEFLASLEQL